MNLTRKSSLVRRSTQPSLLQEARLVSARFPKHRINFVCSPHSGQESQLGGVLRNCVKAGHLDVGVIFFAGLLCRDWCTDIQRRRAAFLGERRLQRPLSAFPLEAPFHVYGCRTRGRDGKQQYHSLGEAFEHNIGAPLEFPASD